MALKRVYNFCAGPAALPAAVMVKAQEELVDWCGLGISVMEISHRSKEYQQLTAKAESDLRQLMGIGDEFAVLFMHGGATAQFSAIPMALLGDGQTAEYIVDGIWSKKAADEAERFGQVHRVEIINKQDDQLRMLELEQWQRAESPAYTHYTPNETIEGIRIESLKRNNGAPLIADMSSCILAENINIDDFDMIYAGAQKNIGPAGMTLVIVRKSLFDSMRFDRIPRVLNYQLQADNGSMLNTPATYTWYLAALVFEWLLEQGGVSQMEELSRLKSEKLYRYLDESDFYTNPIQPEIRSRMNVPFVLRDESFNTAFLEEAEEQGLVGLKGHRSLGGMRASLYNSMPLEGVDALITFMDDFAQKHAS